MIWLNELMLTAALTISPYMTNSVAQESMRLGRNTEAISQFKTAVLQSSATFGPRHPGTAMVLGNLALAYRREGYLSQAERTAQQALDILEDRFGTEDVSVVPALNVLTAALAQQGRLSEARKSAERAVSIGPEAGDHYTVALSNLSALSAGEKRWESAALRRLR